MRLKSGNKPRKDWCGTDRHPRRWGFGDWKIVACFDEKGPFFLMQRTRLSGISFETLGVYSGDIWWALEACADWGMSPAWYRWLHRTAADVEDYVNNYNAKGKRYVRSHKVRSGEATSSASPERACVESSGGPGIRGEEVRCA